MDKDLFKNITSHAKEYGFVFPSSEIYDGLSAVYDYGPYGTLLKNNIKEYWWKSMVQLHENIVGLDASILMHPKVWKASGHVDAFHDPMIDNKDSKKRYRADNLIEGYIEKIEQKIQKEIKKARKRFGDSFDEVKFLNESPKINKYRLQIDQIKIKLNNALANNDLAELKKLIEELQIADPVSGSRNWTDVKQFNLMFDTRIGASSDSSSKIYLRPETAQGIFVNFSNVLKTSRMKIPFGIAQTGKAFRNEIIARQFIFRMREFEQMEMQFFVRPGTEKKWFAYWKETRLKWHLSLKMGEELYRFHDHEQLAHYADAATDIEFRFPFGFKELEGIHSRTDFDLKSHEEHSGRKLRYFDPETRETYIPYVIETSIGLDRMFLAVLSASYTEETLPDESTRTVLKIPAVLAPVKVAVLPLVKKDGLPEIARNIFDELKWDFQTVYDEKDAIGRRYRRQDAIGTPYAITVDHQTKDDGTVTLRNRDTMEQTRVAVSEIKKELNEKLRLKNWLGNVF
jgi:glycyl-tRNA synthetase